MIEPSSAVTRTRMVLLPSARLVLPVAAALAAASWVVATTTAEVVPRGNVMVAPFVAVWPATVKRLRLVLVLSGVT